MQTYHLRDGRTEPPRFPFASKKTFRLTEAQLTKFHAKLDALIKETDALAALNQDRAGEPFVLTVVFHKQAGEDS